MEDGDGLNVRNIKNLPVLLEDTLEILGRVEKVIIGDDYKLLYLVVTTDSEKPGIVFQNDFSLTEESVKMWNEKSIKSYAHGEELSIYDKKIGDKVFDSEGKELGVVSDFVINKEDKKVWGVEVSSGAIKDILDGRIEIPLKQVKWASSVNAIVNTEGSGLS